MKEKIAIELTPFDPYYYMSDEQLVDFLVKMFNEEEEPVFNRACKFVVTFRGEKGGVLIGKALRKAVARAVENCNRKVYGSTGTSLAAPSF